MPGAIGFVWHVCTSSIIDKYVIKKKNNEKLKNIVKQERLSIPADIVMDIESLIQSWL